MSERFFNDSFDKKEKDKLYLKEFWTEEPCNWTVTNYLTKLIALDPAISRRTASNRIINDSTVLRNNVVSGSVAETMARAMSSYLENKRGKKTFNSFFNDNADVIGKETTKYNMQKLKLRSSMAEQVVNEEDKENTNKKRIHDDEGSSLTRPKKLVVTDNHGDEGSSVAEPKNLFVNNNHDEQRSLWDEWKAFLEDEHNTKGFFSLSPEKHKVIWCGKQLRRRSCFPVDLYKKLNNEIPFIPIEDINSHLYSSVLNVFDAGNIIDMDKTIKVLDNLVVSDLIIAAEKNFIVSICQIYKDDIFNGCGVHVLQASESCYRSYLFDACIKFISRYLRTCSHNVTFFPGEVELEAMTEQLKQQGIQDRRFKYNADGTFKANDFSALEFLLTEVSSGYGSTDTTKVSFDHHKAMFGLLAMMRSIAQMYDEASFETFSRLKIHFIHAHGTGIRHWTMSTLTPGIYFMTKEQRIDVPVSFTDKDLTLHPFVIFLKTIAVACEQTLSVLNELKNEHKNGLRSKKKEKHQRLSSIINPVIIRLNESRHASIVSNQGPISLNNSPSHC